MSNEYVAIDEEAKARREAVPLEVMEPWSRFPKETSFARYFLGFQPEAATLYLTAGPKSRVLWICDELLASPCLKHHNGRFANDHLTTRFEIGEWDKPGYTVRCSFVEGKGHCVALPTYPEADPFIRIYRHRSYEEWTNEPGYRALPPIELNVNTVAEGTRVAEKRAAEECEARFDPRSNTVYVRRKMEGAPAQTVMGQQ